MRSVSKQKTKHEWMNERRSVETPKKKSFIKFKVPNLYQISRLEKNFMLQPNAEHVWRLLANLDKHQRSCALDFES